jgi:hypothetical protein
METSGEIEPSHGLRHQFDFPSTRHLVRNRSFVTLAQVACGQRENKVVLYADMLLVQPFKLSHEVSKTSNLADRKAALCQILHSQVLHLGM